MLPFLSEAETLVPGDGASSVFDTQHRDGLLFHRSDANSRRVGDAKPLRPSSVLGHVTIARRVLGALLVVTGAVWLGQGLDLIQGSSMTGSTFWAADGALCAVGGLGVLSWP